MELRTNYTFVEQPKTKDVGKEKKCAFMVVYDHAAANSVKRSNANICDIMNIKVASHCIIFSQMACVKQTS